MKLKNSSVRVHHQQLSFRQSVLNITALKMVSGNPESVQKICIASSYGAGICYDVSRHTGLPKIFTMLTGCPALVFGRYFAAYRKLSGGFIRHQIVRVLGL